METELKSSTAAEVIAILENTETSLLAKIPIKLIQFFESKANEENLKYKLDFNKNYDEQELSEEARTIMTLIYKDYIATPNQKNELNEKILQKQIEEEKELREKYNPDNIFKNNNIDSQKTPKELSMVKIDEIKWYEKIINKIKSFFK